MGTDEVGSDRVIDDGFHPLAIAVIHERCIGEYRLRGWRDCRRHGRCVGTNRGRGSRLRRCRSRGMCRSGRIGRST